MTDENLLEKIGDIVDKRITESEKKFDKRITESEIKMEHRFNSVDKRFNGVDQELHAIKKQQNQDRTDWTEFFHEAGIFFDEMKEQLLKRITRIENHLGFSKN